MIYVFYRLRKAITWRQVYMVVLASLGDRPRFKVRLWENYLTFLSISVFIYTAEMVMIICWL